jgi:hypothetical protein
MRPGSGGERRMIEGWDKYCSAEAVLRWDVLAMSFDLRES